MRGHPKASAPDRKVCLLRRCKALLRGPRQWKVRKGWCEKQRQMRTKSGGGLRITFPSHGSTVGRWTEWMMRKSGTCQCITTGSHAAFPQHGWPNDPHPTRRSCAISVARFRQAATMSASPLRLTVFQDRAPNQTWRWAMPLVGGREVLSTS